MSGYMFSIICIINKPKTTVGSFQKVIKDEVYNHDMSCNSTYETVGKQNL